MSNFYEFLKTVEPTLPDQALTGKGKILICCPYHDDRNPSMALYIKEFDGQGATDVEDCGYCYSCSTRKPIGDILLRLANGDVITAISALPEGATLHGLNPNSAQLKKLWISLVNNAGSYSDLSKIGWKYLNNRLEAPPTDQILDLITVMSPERVPELRQAGLGTVMDKFIKTFAEGRWILFLVGNVIVGRRMGDEKPRYKNFIIDGTKLECSFLNRQPKDPDVFICEGIFDALRLLQHGLTNVLCLLGISPKGCINELVKVLQYKENGFVNHFHLMGDGDEAGAKMNKEIGYQLFMHPSIMYEKINIYNFPNGLDVDVVLKGRCVTSLIRYQTSLFQHLFDLYYQSTKTLVKATANEIDAVKRSFIRTLILAKNKNVGKDRQSYFYREDAIVSSLTADLETDQSIEKSIKETQDLLSTEGEYNSEDSEFLGLHFLDLIHTSTKKGGSLALLSGLSGSGKTLTAITMALNVLAADPTALIFIACYDESRESVIRNKLFPLLRGHKTLTDEDVKARSCIISTQTSLLKSLEDYRDANPTNPIHVVVDFYTVVPEIQERTGTTTYERENSYATEFCLRTRPLNMFITVLVQADAQTPLTKIFGGSLLFKNCDVCFGIANFDQVTLINNPKKKIIELPAFHNLDYDMQSQLRNSKVLYPMKMRTPPLLSVDTVRAGDITLFVDSHNPFTLHPSQWLRKYINGNVIKLANLNNRAVGINERKGSPLGLFNKLLSDLIITKDNTKSDKRNYKPQSVTM